MGGWDRVTCHIGGDCGVFSEGVAELGMERY